MTIRTRMTLWYAGVFLVSALVITGLSFRELHHQRDKTEDPGESWEDVVDWVCWIGIPAVVLSVGGGWWLMRKALAPIATLTHAAERINERNLGEQLPRTRNGDELDRLTEVLNAMTARLNDSFTRIRDFTLHASHELKTPLTILSGETETELSDESLTAPQREGAASRLDELQRLARIVDGLTLLAKADAGQIILAFEPLAFDDLVRDCFADAQILAQAADIRVEMTAWEKAVVQGDPHRLRQLLLNLADNAVKYNQPRGSITMSLRRAGDAAEFAISNSGPGIAPEALPRVFDRFFRGDPAHCHDTDGCGLGLSIAQWIASVHKGSINIQSIPSKLTTVTVRLPLIKGGRPA